MVHTFTINGTNLVLDVESGSVHVMDDDSLGILRQAAARAVSHGDAKTIVESLSFDKKNAEICQEILYLIDNGMLFTEEFIPPAYAVQAASGLKAICLHVSHDCDLRCRYCFASTGHFGGGRRLMDASTGKAAVDFLIASSKGRYNLEIDFFGGEPLLNFDTVKEVIWYADQKAARYNKNFRYTLTTNAYSITDEQVSFLNEHCYNVVLSADGRRSVHDGMRVKPDGSGSYDRVMPNIRKFVSSRNGQTYYVRGTFTRKNMDFSKDVLHLADEGYRSISIEPVVAAANPQMDILGEDIPVLKAEYEKLAVEYVKRYNEGNGFEFYHFMLDLDGGPCIYKRLKNCGAGYEYLAVTPEGDIYPCHQFVGNRRFHMGNMTDGITNREISDRFIATDIFHKDGCRDCWAKYYCSGGCSANAFMYNGDITKPYKIGCELQKKRLECALWVKSQIQDKSLREHAVT